MAWTYDTGEKGGGFRGWSVTPIVVDNVIISAWRQLVALNAETGAELWKFELRRSAQPVVIHRGISYWSATRRRLRGSSPPRPTDC